MIKSPLLYFALLCGLSTVGHTQTAVNWANLGTDWTTPGNWVGGSAPLNSTSINKASFGYTSGTAYNPNLASAQNIAGLVFTSTANSYSFTGAALTIGASGISNASTSLQRIANTLNITTSVSWTTAAGGQLELSGTVDLNNSNTSSRTLTVDGAGNTTFSGVIQNSVGPGNLTHNGTGTVTLASANTYSGTTTLNSTGTLNLNHASALGTGMLVFAGSGTLDNTSGGAITMTTNNAQSWGANFTFAGTNSLNMGTGTVAVTASRQVTVGANTLTVGGIIDVNNSTGSRSLTFLGAGNAVLSGIVKNSGSGSGAVAYSGTGTLTLSGANTYTGGTTLTSGTLNVNHASALGTGTLTLAGGTLDNTSGSAITNANNNAQTWSGNFNYNGSNPLNLGTGAITMTASRQVNVAASTLTLGGTISGVGFGLAKSGAGTLSLGGANSYTGPTAIMAGTLNVTGSLAAASSVTINSGGTLSGTGTVNGSTVLASGGSIKPGTGGIGTLTLAHGLTWNGGGAMVFDLGAGNSSDQLALGANAFAKGSAGTYGFNFQNTGISGSSYTLVTSSIAGTFLASDFSYSNLGSGLTGAFSFSGNDLMFTVTAIPEPATYGMLLGLVALAGVGWLRRKQKGQNLFLQEAAEIAEK